MENIPKLGFAFTGSFCTFKKVFSVLEEMSKSAEIIPIFSDSASEIDSRFGSSAEFIEKAEQICGNKAITSIPEAEPIGPKKLLDALIIAPCTGNTTAKLANGIADTTVTLAAKSQLRNNRPIVIAVSTNDGLGANAVNIGKLLARKNIYLVPFGQDDCIEKENSIVADFKQIPTTLVFALKNKQIQPILI